jgi:pimeloyl-ACP methyl ester carboxylesterase
MKKVLQAIEKKIKNHTFHGYRCGDPNLPVLVCLHGMTGDSFSFLGMIDFLTKDFQLILIDGPGHGQIHFNRRVTIGFPTLRNVTINLFKRSQLIKAIRY